MAASTLQPPAPSADPVPALREQVDALLREQAELCWKGWTTGAPVDVRQTYAGRDRLASPESIAALGAAMERAQGAEQRALSYLRAFLIGEFLAREAATATARAAAARAGASFEWEGQQVPEYRVNALLAAEPEAARRAAIARAHAAAASRWIRVADDELEAVVGAVRKLGYPAPLALAAELRGRPAEALASLADAVLGATDAVYRALMDELARRELGLQFDSIRGRDYPRLFRAGQDPHAFPAQHMWSDAAAVFAGLGMDPGAQKSLMLLDAERRAHKDPRPLMLPIDVPGRIRVSFIPTDGAEALRALLNELGTGEYYAHVTSPVMEFRRLGPASLPAAWGLLFAGIVAEPAWLADRAGAPSSAAIERQVRGAAALRVHLARESAARILFEVERAREPARAGDIWARIASRAFARAVDPEEATAWRIDPDPLLHAADTLRAILLAAQVEASLAKRAGGRAWWRCGACGAGLAKLWAGGSSRAPEEVSAAMGYPALDAAALVEITRLRTSTAGTRP